MCLQQPPPPSMNGGLSHIAPNKKSQFKRFGFVLYSIRIPSNNFRMLKLSTMLMLIDLFVNIESSTWHGNCKATCVVWCWITLIEKATTAFQCVMHTDGLLFHEFMNSNRSLDWLMRARVPVERKCVKWNGTISPASECVCVCAIVISHLLSFSFPLSHLSQIALCCCTLIRETF